jgi:hypothetical protein
MMIIVIINPAVAGAVSLGVNGWENDADHLIYRSAMRGPFTLPSSVYLHGVFLYQNGNLFCR